MFSEQAQRTLLQSIVSGFAVERNIHFLTIVLGLTSVATSAALWFIWPRSATRGAAVVLLLTGAVNVIAGGVGLREANAAALRWVEWLREAPEQLALAALPSLHERVVSLLMVRLVEAVGIAAGAVLLRFRGSRRGVGVALLTVCGCGLILDSVVAGSLRSLLTTLEAACRTPQ